MTDRGAWLSEAGVRRLRFLWGQGVVTNEIAREFGVSKNAIVGKVHRLELDPRPSPIRRDRFTVPAPRAPRLVAVSTLAPLASELLAPPAIAAPEPDPPPPILEPTPRPAPVTRPRRECCWPIGQGKALRFCDAEAEVRRPYCEEHSKLAYQKTPKREDASPAYASAGGGD